MNDDGQMDVMMMNDEMGNKRLYTSCDVVRSRVKGQPQQPLVQKALWSNKVKEKQNLLFSLFLFGFNHARHQEGPTSDKNLT